MLVDWSGVAASVAIALVSAYIGTLVKASFDRARLVVALSSCRLASGPDLIFASVTIDQPLSERLRVHKWAPTLHGTVNAYHLDEVIQGLRRSIAEARDALNFLDLKIGELPQLEKAPAGRKLQFLDQITDVRVVVSTFVAALVRQEFEHPLPPDSELETRERIAAYSESEGGAGGYDIHLGTSWLELHYKGKRDNRFLLPCAKAFSFFYVPYLVALLRHAREEMARLEAQGDTLVADLQRLIDQSRHLIVELTVVNRGSTPAILTPWAVLWVSSAGDDRILEIRLAHLRSIWQPSDPVVAMTQTKILKEVDDPRPGEEQGFVVGGGNTQRISYESADPIVDSERRIPSIQDALLRGVFVSQVAIKRADVANRRKSWVLSPKGPFGIRGEQFPRDEIKQIKPKWKGAARLRAANSL